MHKIVQKYSAAMKTHAGPTLVLCKAGKFNC